MLKKCIKPQAVIEYLQTVTIGFFLGIFKFKSVLRIRIQRAKYQPKTTKKNLLSKPKSEQLKKE